MKPYMGKDKCSSDFANYKLKSNDELSQLALSLGLDSWNKLTNYVMKLPYGRNKNRTDFGLVLAESKGTCSSKHGLLKVLAELNEFPNIKLILGIFKMNAINTPKIITLIEKHSINYIPEAHCYLNINGIRKDYTSVDSDFTSIEKDIIQEIEIESSQIAEYKVDYHKNYLKNWLVEHNFSMTFEEFWDVREKCIQLLSN